MLRRLFRSSLLRNASVYGVSNLLRQAVPLLLVPVLTRYLTPEDYGTQAVFTVLAAVLTPLVGLNIHAAIARKYYDRDTIDLPSYVWTCLVVFAVTTVVASLGVWIFSDSIAAISEVPRGWLWAAVLVGSAQVIILVVLGLAQVEGRPALYGTVQVGRTALIAGVTSWLVIVLEYDWRGSVIGQLVGAIAFVLLSMWLLVRGDWLRMRFDAAYARHALAYGVPLVPHVLSAVVVQTIDRLFVAHHAGLGQTGLYALGYQLGALIGLVEDSFNRAFQPWLFEQLKRDDAAVKRRLVLFTYGYFAAISALAIGLGVSAPAVLSVVVPERFQGAHVHVIWIAMGFAFNGMYKMVSGYIFFAERTGMLAWITACAAAVNVGLNYVLVPRYGALGSAYATTVSFFSSFALSWIVSIRVYPMPWALRRTP